MEAIGGGKCMGRMEKTSVEGDGFVVSKSSAEVKMEYVIESILKKN